jgi:hypothetical protein
MHAPSDIDGARVVKVADLSHTTATGATRHYRDRESQTGFAWLALAKYDHDPGIYLFYCDEVWNCLNNTYHDDLAAAEAQAAFEFEGVVCVDP